MCHALDAACRVAGAALRRPLTPALLLVDLGGGQGGLDAYLRVSGLELQELSVVEAGVGGGHWGEGQDSRPCGNDHRRAG